MGLADIIVILIAAIPVGLAVRYLWKIHKMGGCAGCSECCGGNCHGSCSASPKEEEKKSK